MVEITVQVYKKSEKKPEDWERVVVMFDGHRAPDYYDPMDGDFHFYGNIMGPDDLWFSVPENLTTTLSTGDVVHNMLRDILHYEQHHEKSEGITQFIKNKYEKYI